MDSEKAIKYDTKITVKFDKETLDKLDFFVAQTQTNRSKIIRDIIKENGKIIIRKDKENKKELLYELNKIGNNINQITYILNLANKENLLSDVDYKTILQQLQILNFQMKETLDSKDKE